MNIKTPDLGSNQGTISAGKFCRESDNLYIAEAFRRPISNTIGGMNELYSYISPIWNFTGFANI